MKKKLLLLVVVIIFLTSAFSLGAQGGAVAFCDKSNMYAVASSWLGSGFGIKTGMRFYF